LLGIPSVELLRIYMLWPRQSLTFSSFRFRCSQLLLCSTVSSSPWLVITKARRIWKNGCFNRVLGVVAAPPHFLLKKTQSNLFRGKRMFARRWMLWRMSFWMFKMCFRYVPWARSIVAVVSKIRR
jgi:hypothetical protein